MHEILWWLVPEISHNIYKIILIKKFKGFSKLPEAVQEKMDPTLAKKFEDGGPVKMGSGGGVCKGMGIARAGGKFKLR